jgi:hypothetical protein
MFVRAYACVIDRTNGETMKTRLLALALVLLSASSASLGQQEGAWPKWSWLIGEWTGEGSGQPGQGGGTFSLQPDLGGKVLVRKNHSEYPATKDNPKVVHDDLMIVYRDGANEPDKAIYFDNEGHTIAYAASFVDTSIVLTSGKLQNMPVFRLTYVPLDKDTLTVRFEMSQDGTNFKVYTEGKCKRTKKP